MKRKAAPQYATKVLKRRREGGEWRGKVLASRGDEEEAVFAEVLGERGCRMWTESEAVKSRAPISISIRYIYLLALYLF